MNLNAIKDRMNALQQSTYVKKEKIDYAKYLWKPKSEGKFQIRFVPSKFNKDNPFKEVFVHYGFGKFPIFALTNWGEKDPIVEFAKQLRTTSEKENWSLAKKLDPKMRIFAPVVVRGEEDKGVRLWEFGKEIYSQLLGIADDEDYGDYTDIKEGRDFTVEAVIGDVGGRQGLKCSIRVKPKTSSLSDNAQLVEKWLDEQPDILEIQYKNDFEKLKTILQNWLDPEESEEEVAEVVSAPPVVNKVVSEKPKATSSPIPVKKSKADQFDDLFNEGDVEDDLPF